jgi:hypothetical protein
VEGSRSVLLMYYIDINMVEGGEIPRNNSLINSSSLCQRIETWTQEKEYQSFDAMRLLAPFSVSAIL